MVETDKDGVKRNLGDAEHASTYPAKISLYFVYILYQNKQMYFCFVLLNLGLLFFVCSVYQLHALLYQFHV